MSAINKTIENGKALFELQGRLDTVSAPRLEQEIRSSLDGVDELTFDLKELEYISSAGLRVLLTAQKIMNKQGTMTIRNANEMVTEVFEITGFSDILTIV